MDKKEYEAPKMEIVEMPYDIRLLSGSNNDDEDGIVGHGVGSCKNGDCSDEW